ncbi:hypothetical protein ASE09_02175 [Streptomyces sp. Root66D1]|nr:hypothetical protein ASD33_02175 [Streptomyces sp. Root1304]KRB00387.1 hypothetical protein ASE09_02175 [Streptomyces sp. Root66D1]
MNRARARRPLAVLLLAGALAGLTGCASAVDSIERLGRKAAEQVGTGHDGVERAGTARERAERAGRDGVERTGAGRDSGAVRTATE